MTYQISNNIKMLHFDLNMTEACNMRCDYCFEPKTEPKSFQKIGLFKKRISEILESDFFIKNYELLNINFWGGEPTLRFKEIEEIVNFFSNENRVRFFIFSNGYNVKPLYDLLNRYKFVKVKGNHPKICIQISYDGSYLHDTHRVDIYGMPTSEKVVKTIGYLDTFGIPYVVKPVINPSDFRFLSLAYADIKNLTYENNPSFFKSQNYNPTIEYYNSESATEKEVSMNLYELRKSLIEIASEEIVAIKDKGHRPFFSWFFPSKAICSAGVHYFAIDIDGQIYPCHGVFYDDKKQYSKIADLEWDKEVLISSLESNNRELGKHLNILPDECKSCDTNFCMKCNVVKFKNSRKTKYIERWTDYANQPILCKYYKEIGKVAKIFDKKMRKG